MRRLLALPLAAALALLPGTVHSDAGLTSLVNAAYFPRTESAELHSLAHERAAFQVTFSGGRCNEDSLTHDGLVTAEVLACNYDGDPLTQWQESPPHDLILSDRNLNLIGCGSAPGIDGSTFYACVLTSSPISQPTPQPIVPAPPAEVPPPVLQLPNTAMGSG